MDKDWSPVKDAPQRREAPTKSAHHEHHLPPPKTWLIFGGVAFLIFLFFLVGVPAMKGYKVYKAMQESGVPEEYFTDVQGMQEKIQQQEAQLQALMGQRDAANQQLASCTTEKETVAANTGSEVQRLDNLLEICSKDVNTAKDRLESCEEEVEDSEALIADAARRVCCIARVNDASITGYEIDGQRITCVSDGGTSISC